MKTLKYVVWFAGMMILLALAYQKGISDGSGYIQFVDGVLLVYAFGEFIEKRAHIKRFIENHKALHERVEHLHEKFDKHIGKKDES